MQKHSHTNSLPLIWPLFMPVLVCRWSSSICRVHPWYIFLSPWMKGRVFKSTIMRSHNRQSKPGLGRKGFQVWTRRLPAHGGQEEKPLLDFQGEHSPVPIQSGKEPQYLAEPMPAKWKMESWPCRMLALDTGQPLALFEHCSFIL